MDQPMCPRCGAAPTAFSLQMDDAGDLWQDVCANCRDHVADGVDVVPLQAEEPV